MLNFTCSGMTGLGKGSNIRLLMEKHQITRAVYVGDTQGDYNACQKAQEGEEEVERWVLP